MSDYIEKKNGKEAMEEFNGHMQHLYNKLGFA
jgi:hypothetical protein